MTGVTLAIAVLITAFTTAAVRSAFLQVAAGLTNAFSAQTSLFPVGTFAAATAAAVIAALFVFTAGHAFTHAVYTGHVIATFTACSATAVIATFIVTTAGSAGRIDAIVAGCPVFVVDPVTEFTQRFTIGFKNGVIFALDQNIALAFSNAWNVRTGTFARNA